MVGEDERKRRTGIDELLGGFSFLFEFLGGVFGLSLAEGSRDAIETLLKPVSASRVKPRKKKTHLMHCNLPLLQFLQPRIEELKVLDSNLLRCTRQLGFLVLLARTRAECVLEVGIDGIVGLSFAFRERDDVQVERFALLNERGG